MHQIHTMHNHASLLATITHNAQPYDVKWPPLWSSGQRSGFDSRRYQIFRGVVGLERDPLSLVSTTEELLGKKSSGSCLENREYDRRDPSR
jgi:hypothetical protein